MIRFLLLFLCIFAGGISQAEAQTAYAGGSPIVLTIPVTASIGGRCTFATGAAPSGTYNKDNFDRDGFSNQFAFSLNCTGPSRVAISSSNGGLLTPASAPTGYRNKADYQVTLNLAANNGSTAQATCDASTLQTGGNCSFQGTASSTKGLYLSSPALNQAGSYVRVSSAAQSTASSPLVEGSYSDALTVTVSPAI